jgi:diguanylate cyclase (GGDEF)-like protein
LLKLIMSKLARLEKCLTPEEEERYRQRFLRSDATQAMFGIILLLLITFNYILYQYVGPVKTLPLMRWTFVLISVGLIVYLRFIKNPRLYDWIIFIWSLAIIAVNSYGQIMHPEIYRRDFLFDVIIILTFYIIIPYRMIFRMISALSMTATGIFLIIGMGGPLTVLDTIAILSFYVLSNVAGALMSIRMYRQRRNEFIALENEQVLRKQMATMAETDELTGLLNRRKFIELGEKQAALYRRFRRPSTFMFIDLDHFKSVNDTYGHQAGDAVLCYFADLVKKLLRTVDVVGRLGGEEFGILLVETPLDSALAVAERIRITLAGTSVPFDGKVIQVTASIGMSEMSGEDFTLDAVISRADSALYRAKNAGRNRVEVSK